MPPPSPCLSSLSVGDSSEVDSATQVPEGSRDHVLLHGVHLSGHRVLLDPARAEGGPSVVVHPPHQHGVRRQTPYRLAHLPVEVGEVSLIVVHHPVQRHSQTHLALLLATRSASSITPLRKGGLMRARALEKGALEHAGECTLPVGAAS